MLTCEVGIWVDSGAGHVVLFSKALALVDKRNDGVELLVRLTEGGLELRMRVDQALNKRGSVRSSTNY